MEVKSKKIVFFDGHCNLCNRAVQFILKYDRSKKIYLSSLKSDFSQKLLNEHNISSDMDSIIYFRNGTILTKSDAALYIMWDINGIWRVSHIFFIIPKFIRDYLYDLIAKYRYVIWGRSDRCYIDEDYSERFL